MQFYFSEKICGTEMFAKPYKEISKNLSNNLLRFDQITKAGNTHVHQ